MPGLSSYLLTFSDNVGRKAYQAEMAKYESTYFNFGDQEWNISIYPMGDGTNESRRPLIQLNRLSGRDGQHVKIG